MTTYRIAELDNGHSYTIEFTETYFDAKMALSAHLCACGAAIATWDASGEYEGYANVADTLGRLFFIEPYQVSFKPAQAR